MSKNTSKHAVWHMCSLAATPAVHIRHAHLSDLDNLLLLEQHSFTSDRLSRAQYRHHLSSESAQILVAHVPRQALLGAAVIFFRRRSTAARLYSLASTPAARGKGVGTALIHAAGQSARQRGCRVLRLEVRADNATAIRLYERLGFRNIGHRIAYYEDGTDAWRYEQSLT